MCYYKITINNEVEKFTSNSLNLVVNEAVYLLDGEPSGTVATVELDRDCNDGIKPLFIVTKDNDGCSVKS